jgi:hypothetical protein
MKDFFKDYFTKTYAIYVLRWLASALVMLPIMAFLESILPLWANLAVGQIFGSIIFFKIDKWILNEEDIEVDVCLKHHHNHKIVEDNEHQSDDHYSAPYKIEPKEPTEPSVSERKL